MYNIIMNIFETLSQNIIYLIKDNMWIGPVFSLVAGIFTSLTPCALSNIPLVTGYISAVDKRYDTKKALMLSIVFAAGAAVTFLVLGIAASEVGNVLKHIEFIHIIFGAVMILMALQTWEIINIIPHIHVSASSNHGNFIGVFITGLIGGLFSSHCAIPAILLILALAHQNGSLAWIALMLLFYSAGHGIIIIIAGISAGFTSRLESGAADKTTHIFRIFLGFIMAAIGIYMIVG